MKHLNYLTLVPALVLVFIVMNGIGKRIQDTQLAFAVEDVIDYSNIPGMKVTPIRTKISRELVASSRGNRPCLVTYNNKAYEIPQGLFEVHKGGIEHLTQACGTDISFIFNIMPHTKSAINLLDKLYYADLTD